MKVYVIIAAVATVMASAVFVSNHMQDRVRGLGLQERLLARQRYLLYEIDHDELHKACQEVIQNLGKYRKDPAWQVSDGDNRYPDAQDPTMPAAIRALRPMYLAVHDGHVVAEMSGGSYHFGVRSYVPGVQGEGAKELTKGLWYYSDDGGVPAPELNR